MKCQAHSTYACQSVAWKVNLSNKEIEYDIIQLYKEQDRLKAEPPAIFSWYIPKGLDSATRLTLAQKKNRSTLQYNETSAWSRKGSQLVGYNDIEKPTKPRLKMELTVSQM